MPRSIRPDEVQCFGDVLHEGRSHALLEEHHDHAVGSPTDNRFMRIALTGSTDRNTTVKRMNDRPSTNAKTIACTCRIG